MQYLGHLPFIDPLYGYLKNHIQPQLNNQKDVDYRVFRLNGSNDVFLYEEKYSKTKLIGKFFQSDYSRTSEAAFRHMLREYHHLSLMRKNGFSGSPHYVPRPLGCNADLNHLLVIEYCQGQLLSDVITQAIQSQDESLLFNKLTALAYFLASFHNQTADFSVRVNFEENIDYLNALIERLISADIEQHPSELYGLRDCWQEQSKMWEDVPVLVHGDATPANFMCGDGLHIIGLDLERLHQTDRVFDTGRIAGELAHFFLLQTGSREGAEKFIGHFLWEYACHFPDRKQAFDSMNRRIPFYMGMTFLRIARNNWLSWRYRKKLLAEGKICLREFYK